MMTKSRRWACGMACALAMIMPVLARADVTVLLDTELYPTDKEPQASGSADGYETLGYPFDAELTVIVRDVFSTDTVAVLINGEFVATIALADGSGEVTLQGRLGTDVPFINQGDVLDIVRADDGVLLLEGVFD